MKPSSAASDHDNNNRQEGSGNDKTPETAPGGDHNIPFDSHGLERLKITNVNDVNTKNPNSDPTKNPRYLYSIDGIFDQLKQYDEDTSPFLPIGRLDLEFMKKRLLDDVYTYSDTYNINPKLITNSQLTHERFVAHETEAMVRLLWEEITVYPRIPLSTPPRLTNVDNYKIGTFKGANFSKLSLDTYFYIFYNMPRDKMQKLATLELLKRHWLYSGSHKLWFKNITNDKGNAASTIQQSPTASWVYFDPTLWSQRSYVVTSELERALLSKNDIEQLFCDENAI